MFHVVITKAFFSHFTLVRIKKIVPAHNETAPCSFSPQTNLVDSQKKISTRSKLYKKIKARLFTRIPDVDENFNVVGGERVCFRL